MTDRSELVFPGKGDIVVVSNKSREGAAWVLAFFFKSEGIAAIN